MFTFGLNYWSCRLCYQSGALRTIQLTISLLVSDAVIFLCHHPSLLFKERLRRRLVNYGDEFNQRDDPKEHLYGKLLGTRIIRNYKVKPTVLNVKQLVPVSMLSSWFNVSLVSHLQNIGETKHRIIITKLIDLLAKKQICTCSPLFCTVLCCCFARPQCRFARLEEELPYVLTKNFVACVRGRL